MYLYPNTPLAQRSGGPFRSQALGALGRRGRRSPLPGRPVLSGLGYLGNHAAPTFTSSTPGQATAATGVWTKLYTQTPGSQDPLSYVSPQAAIAAGLDSRTVYAKWAAAINKYPSANAAIAAGVPAGVATQLWGSPCGCKRKRKLFGLGQDDGDTGVVYGSGSPYDTIDIAVAAQQATAAQAAAQIDSGPATGSLTSPQAPYPTSLAPGTVTNYGPGQPGIVNANGVVVPSVLSPLGQPAPAAGYATVGAPSLIAGIPNLYLGIGLGLFALVAFSGGASNRRGR
jgi:hypothetical protein